MRGRGASVEAILDCVSGLIDCLVVEGGGRGKEEVEVGEERVCLNLWWGSWLARGRVYVGQVCRDPGFLASPYFKLYL